MTTGNKIVDAVSELRINSIPETWYFHIRKNNQPNAMAILLLWDIIYWYKCTEVRDENTGLLLCIKKKFKSDDFLQRNYQQIADKFGISKKVATTLTDDLVKIGVIKKHFRTINVNGLKCSNVMFIEVVPSVLKSLSSFEGYTPTGVGGIPLQGDTLPPRGNSSYDEQGDTNTNIITSNYTNNYTTPSETPKPFVDTEDCKLAEIETDSKPVQFKKVPSSPSAKQKRTRKTLTDDEINIFFADYTEAEVKKAKIIVNAIYKNAKQIDPTHIRSENFLRNETVKIIKFRDRLEVDIDNVSAIAKFAISDNFWKPIIKSADKFIKNFCTLKERYISNTCRPPVPKYQKRFQQVFDDSKERDYTTEEDGEFKI